MKSIDNVQLSLLVAEEGYDFASRYGVSIFDPPNILGMTIVNQTKKSYIYFEAVQFTVQFFTRIVKFINLFPVL